MSPEAESSRDVRHDESDEPDEAGGRYRRRREQRCEQKHAPPRSLGVDAQRRRGVVTEREHVDLARPVDERAARERAGSRRAIRRARHVASAAEPIIHHSAPRTVFGSALASATMIAALANAPTITPAMSSVRMSPRAPRPPTRLTARATNTAAIPPAKAPSVTTASPVTPEGEDDHRTDRCAARHTEQIRLGERIAERALQRGAARAQACSNQTRRESRAEV